MRGNEAESSIEAASDLKVGKWSLGRAGEEVWKGASITAFKAEHGTLLTTGQATVLQERVDFQCELLALHAIGNNHPCILKLLQPIIPNHAVLAVIQECLPTVDTVVKKSGPNSRPPADGFVQAGCYGMGTCS